MTNYELGYESGFSGNDHKHHEGLMLDADYAEGYADGQADLIIRTAAR